MLRGMASLPYGKQMLKAALEKTGLFKRKKRISPDEDCERQCHAGIDKDGFTVRFVSDYKGCGVFSTKHFLAGDFLLQYYGERISEEEGCDRMRKTKSNDRLFFYSFRGKRLCIDAEECRGHICQMVNDAPLSKANSTMKLKVFNGAEYLCLFSKRDIQPGEEILFDYGDDKNLWWRNKDSKEMNQFDFDSDSDPFDVRGYVTNSDSEDESEDGEPNQSGYFARPENEDSNLSTASLIVPVQSTELQPHVKLQKVQDAEPLSKPKSSKSSTFPLNNNPTYYKGSYPFSSLTQQPSQVTSGEKISTTEDFYPPSSRELQTHVRVESSLSEDPDETTHTEAAKQDSFYESDEDLTSPPEQIENYKPVTSPHTHININRRNQLASGPYENDAVVQQVYMDVESKPVPHPRSQPQGNSQTTPKMSPEDKFQTDSPQSASPDVENSIPLPTYEEMIFVDIEIEEYPELSTAPPVPTRMESQEPAADEDQPISTAEVRHINQIAEPKIIQNAESVSKPKYNKVYMDVESKPVPHPRSQPQGNSHTTPKMSPEDKFQTDSPQSASPDVENSIPLPTYEEMIFVDVEIEEYPDLSAPPPVPTQMKSQEPAADEDQPISTAEVRHINQIAEPKIIQNAESVSKPKYNKKPDRFCKFCDQIIKGGKLKRHIIRKHKSSLENIPSKVNEKAYFEKFRKEGIHQFNSNLMAQNKEPSMRARLPIREDSLRLCSECKGYYSNKYFFRHKCDIIKPSPLKPKLVMSTTIQQIKDDKEFHEILNRFQDDYVGNLCRTNETVIIVGYRHFNLRRHEEGKEDEVRKVVMAEMRTLGRLYAEFEGQCNGKSVEDMLSRTHLEDLCEAIKTLTTGESEKHGMRQSVDAVILRSVKTLSGHYSSIQEDEKKKEMKHFLEAYRHKSKELIPKARQTSIKNSFEKARRPANLPPEMELRKVKDHIDREISRITTNFHINNYSQLRRLVVSRLTLFNARRGEEASRLLLKEWEDALKGTWLPEEQLEKIDDLAVKYLVGKFKLCYLQGKGKKFVPVLIPTNTVNAIKLLVAERCSFGISTENKFVFGTKERGGNKNSHCSGWHAVNEVCSDAGVTVGITATKMRHRASTYYASLDMSVHDQKIFLDHMGHGKDINRENYQCPQGIRTVAVMGEVLTNMDEGVNHSTAKKLRKLHHSSTEDSEDELMAGVNHSTAKKLRKLHHSSTEDSEDELIDVNHATVKKYRKSRACSSTELHTTSSDDELNEDGSELFPVNSVVGPRNSEQQVKWSDSDTDLVREHFASCIYSNDKGNKGKLPNKKDILQFIYKHKPICIRHLPQQDQYKKVRTKLFNERKTCRTTLQNKMKRITFSPK